MFAFSNIIIGKVCTFLIINIINITYIYICKYFNVLLLIIMFENL